MVLVYNGMLVPHNAVELLHKAADLLNEHGWVQGAYASKFGGGMCALGALNCASTWDVETGTGEPDHPDEAVAMIEEALIKWLQRKGRIGPDGSIVLWNDHPDRDAGEVIDTLHEFANVLAVEAR